MDVSFIEPAAQLGGWSGSADRNGWNAKQVQLVLGHHSPAFTLATYVHLLPTTCSGSTSSTGVGNSGQPEPPRHERDEPEALEAISALAQG